MLVGSRRALFGRKPRYLLRATFNAPDQDYANGQVVDTDTEGVQEGQLAVVEVDGTLAIVSNQLAFTAQATPAWGDLLVYSQAITRALGRGLVATINLSAINKRCVVLWANNTTGADFATDWEHGVYLDELANITPWWVGTNFVRVGTYAATTYQIALLLGGADVNGLPYYAGQNKADYTYGAWYFIKGEAFATWTLLWPLSTENTATLYALLSNFDAVPTFDRIVVPDKDLSVIQVPVAYSSFTAANGISLDAITPEVNGAWTEQSGDWDIQTNRANPDGAAIATVSVVDAADAIVDCTLNGGAGDNPAIDLRYSDANNYWYLQADRVANQLELHEYNATVDTVRANAAVVINDNTDYAARAIMYGQTIDGFLDGGNKITYALAALNETSIIHGIRAENTAGEFDNFVVYPRTRSQYDAVLGGV